MTSADDSFFEQVYAVAREIPLGKVTTYGAIARYIGSPQAARMVGWAMNKSMHAFPPVPAHRVVNRKGLLTGQHFFGYAGQMQEMLEEEGILVYNNQIKDFPDHFWDPVKELDIRG